MELNGRVEHGFERVAEAFREGFDAGRDMGAALAVTLDGELVVDLWGGHADRRRQTPWSEDTLVCMFSVSKAMTALCVLQAVDRGLLELDAPVARYWPEFAAEGKQAVSLRQLLSHRAGLIGFHGAVDPDLYYHWDRTVDALAAERPWWPPGERHGYHARTFGFLLGEVLRRASGKTVGEWFRSEIALPLELDFMIGVPPDELARCADILPARVRPGATKPWSDETRAMMRDYGDASTPTGAAFQNPSLKPGYMNTARFRQAEMPALNGHGTARAVARMYGRTADLLSAELLEQATTRHSLGPDLVLKSVTHFGLGFMLHHPDAPIGLHEGSFGHAGAGGSMAFHDPRTGLGFCFAMNQMQEGMVTGGTSAMRTAHVLYECL